MRHRKPRSRASRCAAWICSAVGRLRRGRASGRTGRHCSRRTARRGRRGRVCGVRLPTTQSRRPTTRHTAVPIGAARRCKFGFIGRFSQQPPRGWRCRAANAAPCAPIDGTIARCTQRGTRWPRPWRAGACIAPRAPSPASPRCCWAMACCGWRSRSTLRPAGVRSASVQIRHYTVPATATAPPEPSRPLGCRRTRCASPCRGRARRARPRHQAPLS